MTTEICAHSLGIVELSAYRCDDSVRWAQEQWGEAVLGDQRRTRRAVALGASLAAHPAASLPAQTGNWNALRSAYRLLAEEDVTHAALIAPHCQHVLETARAATGTVLFIQDSSALDYTRHCFVDGLGPIGDGFERGFYMHSCLAAYPEYPQGDWGTKAPHLLGLAAQSFWTRPEKQTLEASQPPLESKESRTALRNRRNESDIWAETLESIGPPPCDKTGTTWMSVCDREADIYSFLRRARTLGWECLTRICQDRVVDIEGESEQEHLLPYLRSLSQMTSKHIVLRGRDGFPKRTVRLNIAWVNGGVRPPLCGRKAERLYKPISGAWIRCWEDPTESNLVCRIRPAKRTNKTPKEHPEPLEWLLFVTVPVGEAADAERFLEWYSYRWLIEEYHKCLKTGCSAEKRQLNSAAKLQAMIGFTALVSHRLLTLREMARQSPERLAKDVVPASLLQIVGEICHVPPDHRAEMTVAQFWLGVARLGGFIGRRSDGQPGWQTLWRGWLRLQDMSWAIAVTETIAKCG